jgi:hypothetical protein
VSGAIQAALAALEASDADVLTIRAAADALMGQLREVIVTGIRPAPATEEGNGTSEPEPAAATEPAPSSL